MQRGLASLGYFHIGMPLVIEDLNICLGGSVHHSNGGQGYVQRGVWSPL